jgi:predicted  nucleic acid-binding Zn-ribbon protein
MPTSDDLMRLARACANRITPPRKSRQFPSFSEVEEQCEEEYEELLGVLHDDEVYQSADLAVQEQLVESIRAALPEIRHVLLEDLVDNQAAQVWLQQEGAFHLGMAVGLRLAESGYHIADDDEPVDSDELEIEDVLRFRKRADDGDDEDGGGGDAN